MNDLHGIRRTLFLALGILLPGLTACDAFSQGVEANRDVLARAEGVELTVQEAAELLSNQQQLPNQPEVVEALADLWIDYTLLTLAVNEDPGLGHLDLTPVVRREMEQMAVFALRDSVIRPDTALTEEELRSLFEE
ncbi:MAG TPA: hypothetical protein VLL48_14075, partial [Longimicrobiales bacterium]|nr:hypothetical protein [Longimicrobiales bacterium]